MHCPLVRAGLWRICGQLAYANANHYGCTVHDVLANTARKERLGSNAATNNICRPHGSENAAGSRLLTVQCSACCSQKARSEGKSQRPPVSPPGLHTNYLFKGSAAISALRQKGLNSISRDSHTPSTKQRCSATFRALHCSQRGVCVWADLSTSNFDVFCECGSGLIMGGGNYDWTRDQNRGFLQLAINYSSVSIAGENIEMPLCLIKITFPLLLFLNKAWSASGNGVRLIEHSKSENRTKSLINFRLQTSQTRKSTTRLERERTCRKPNEELQKLETICCVGTKSPSNAKSKVVEFRWSRRGFLNSHGDGRCPGWMRSLITCIIMHANGGEQKLCSGEVNLRLEEITEQKLSRAFFMTTV